MAKREIVIQLRIPAVPRKGWLLGAAALVVVGGAIAYASLPASFTSHTLATASDLNSDFTNLDGRVGTLETGSQKKLSLASCTAGQAYNAIAADGTATCTGNIIGNHLSTNSMRPSAMLSGNIAIYGGSSGTPSVTVQAGGDGAFLVELVTGSGSTTGGGSVFSIIPKTAWASVPFCTISGGNIHWFDGAAIGGFGIYYDRSGSTTTSLNFALNVNTISPSTTYDLNVICVEN
jgi:hypothetical protein